MQLYQRPRAAGNKLHDLGDLNVFSHSSGGQKSEIKVLAEF